MIRNSSLFGNQFPILYAEDYYENTVSLFIQLLFSSIFWVFFDFKYDVFTPSCSIFYLVIDLGNLCT